MKNIFTLLLFNYLFISSSKINAQLVVEKVFDISAFTRDMVIDDNNNLYTAAFDDFFSYNLNDPDGSNPKYITSTSNIPVSFDTYNDNDLYFVSGGIYKLDLTIIAPQFETVFLDDESFIDTIEISDNDLYFSDRNGKIFKGDLTASPFIPTEILELESDFEIDKIIIKDDIMYISGLKRDPVTLEVMENIIYTVNLEDAVPVRVELIVLEKDLFVSGIGIYNDLLYISVGNDSIYTLNLNNVTEGLKSNALINNMGLPLPSTFFGAFAINNNTLYIEGSEVDFSNGEEESSVYRIALETLSVNTIENKIKVKLHPNPSSDFIAISGLTENKNYKIYNTLGALVKEGITSNNEKINIQNLANGIYYTKFKESNTVKFVKK